MPPVLRNRSFLGLTVAQFLGAFNDNLFKQLILLLAARFLFPGRDLQGLAAGAFALPFVLFSGIAGDLSEKFSKRSITVAMKCAEIGIMTCGVAALATGHAAALFALLFLMGTHSAFFGPPKYGMVPEIVEPERLLSANSVIGMTTFLAIIVGGAAAGVLMDAFADRMWVPGMTCVGLAVLGLCAALTIRKLAPRRPELVLKRNLFGELFTTLRELRADGTVFGMIQLNSVFWFNGGVVQQVINGMSDARVLALGTRENTVLALLQTNVAASVAAGSLLATPLARRLRPGRLVVLAACGLAACQCLLVLVGPVVARDAGGTALAHVVLAGAGICAGCFAIPITTFIQEAPPDGKKGQAFAVNNFMNWLMIFGAGAFYQAGQWLGAAPTFVCAASSFVMLGMLAWRRRDVARLVLASTSASRP